MTLKNHRLKLATLIMSTGFAMFAMFFGSGNLVFPLMIGQYVGDQFWSGMFGFVITGVMVPFLGLFGVLLHGGSYKKFLNLWGDKLGFFLAVFMLTLLGPIGVVPRCMTVSYGSFIVITDQVNDIIFNFFMAMTLYLMCINQNRVITILGAFLAPLKIASVVLIIACGILNSSNIHLTPLTPLGALKEGALKGYQTMDLLAAIFFASFMIRHIIQKTQRAQLEHYAQKTSLYAMIVGGALLSLIYIGLVFLGAAFADVLKTHEPEKYLSVLAQHTLGTHASIFVSLTIILSCLTTAIALTTVFTEFLKEHVLKNYLSWGSCLLLSVTTAYVVSIFGFSSIAKFLASILSVLYPVLILLTLANLAAFARKIHLAKKINNTL